MPRRKTQTAATAVGAGCRAFGASQRGFSGWSVRSRIQPETRALGQDGQCAAHPAEEDC